MQTKSKIIPRDWKKNFGSIGDRTQADTVKKWNFTTKLEETYLEVKNSNSGKREEIYHLVQLIFLPFSTRHNSTYEKKQRRKKKIQHRKLKIKHGRLHLWNVFRSLRILLFPHLYVVKVMYICICEKRPKPEFGPFTRSHYRFEEFYVWFLSPFLVRCWKGLKNPTSAVYL